MIEPPISILKSLWSRQVDGQWAVSDLKSLSLKPRVGCENCYFAVDSEFELMTTNPIGLSLHQLLSSLGSTEFLMKQSVLPVVAWCGGDELIRTIGTASVISCSGYVLTAAHVLMDPFESGYGATRNGEGLEFADDLHFGVFIPMSPASGRRGLTFFPFEKMWFWGKWVQSPLLHEPVRFEFSTDVAICKIPATRDGSAHQPLHMSVNSFEKGEAAYAIGYAEMAEIPLASNGNIREVSAELYVSIGAVKEVFAANHIERNVPTPGPCFDFEAKIPGKMSGAPIFGANGAVIRGVVSRSFHGERHAYGVMLGPAMDLPLNEPTTSGRTLRSLMNQGNEGIAQIYGAGL